MMESFSIDSLRAGAVDIAQYVLWALVIVGVGFFLWTKYQDKKTFIYPVRIFKQRNNGMVKEFNSRGGYIKKGGVTQFLIKMSGVKKKPASKLPLAELMDEDNRVYYWQVSPEAPLIQVKRKFVIEKILVLNENFKEPTNEENEIEIAKVRKLIDEDEEYNDESDEKKEKIAREIYFENLDSQRKELLDITVPTYAPISTDLKQRAIMEISNYKDILGVDINKQFAYFVTGIIGLVIAGAVIFYIAVNKGDLPILTELAPLVTLGLRNKVFIGHNLS